MIKFGSMANYCYDHHDKNPIYEDYFDDLLDLKNADTTASKSNISILNENSNLSSWNDLETVSTIKSNRYNLNESI
jgi:thiamine biosynthesis protein ThiC